eukprot:IDg7274t1
MVREAYPAAGLPGAIKKIRERITQNLEREAVRREFAGPIRKRHSLCSVWASISGKGRSNWRALVLGEYHQHKARQVFI